MGKFLSLLALLIIGPAQAQQAVQVPATMASIAFGAQVSITEIIPAKTGQRIYITQFTSHPVNTASITLSYGTGTTNFYGPATFQNGENVYIGSGYGAIYAAPISQAVCITIASANAPGWISYAQY